MINLGGSRRCPLHPQADPQPIPEKTVQCCAEPSYRKANLFLQMRDDLRHVVYRMKIFAISFPRVDNQPKLPGAWPWSRIMQYAEGLTDRQAADAVRTRIDWKYVSKPGVERLPGLTSPSSPNFAVVCWLMGAERRLFDRPAGAVSGTRLDQSPWKATHRFDPCPGRHPHAPSLGMCGRDDAPRAQYPWQT